MPSTAPTEKNERKVMGSYFQNMTRDLGMEKESGKRQFQCLWHCQIVESDLVNITQTTVMNEGRKLRLAFHYEEIVEDDCVKRISRNSNGNLTEYWQVWFVNNTPPTLGGNVIRSFSALIQESFEDQVKVSCRFRKTNPSGEKTVYEELSSPSKHLEKILRSTVRLLGEVCDAQSENDVQTCIQISQFNHSAQWKDFVLHGLIIAFFTILSYIGPTVICLYSATEDTLRGIRQITVEGPSPVGFRSLIGNYFFSKDNDTWHRARKFIMRVFLLPIPCLVPAIFVEYLLYQNLLPKQNMLRIDHLFQPFRMFCYSCYCVHAFYSHILQGKPPVAKESRCLFEEENFKSENVPFNWICFHDLPHEMLDHLRPFRNLPMEVLTTVKEGFVMAKDIITGTPICFGVLFGLLICLPMPILYFVVLNLFGELFMALSFPIATLCITTDLTPLWHVVNMHFLHRDRNLLFAARVVVVLLSISLSCFAALGAMFVLRSAAVGVIMLLQLTVAFALSENNLPLVACCVLPSLNLWINYRSFAQKYQDLAVNLFEHCDQLTTKAQKVVLSWHDTTPDHRRTTDNVKRIPKELFDLACRELMPIRKSIYTLVLKTFLTMIFIFLIFSSTMLLNTSTKMKILMACFAGSLPMIVSIYLTRKKQNCNFEEKAFKVAQEYCNKSTPPCNIPRQQSNCTYLGKCEDRNSDLQFYIISLVVYLSLNIYSPIMVWFRFYVTICGMGKFPSTPSEFSQVVYQFPLSTSGLVCECFSKYGLFCRAFFSACT